MVTLHELDFPSLRVTVLQTADGGTTQFTAQLVKDRLLHYVNIITTFNRYVNRFYNVVLLQHHIGAHQVFPY
jgi:hypothetical protein